MPVAYNLSLRDFQIQSLTIFANNLPDAEPDWDYTIDTTFEVDANDISVKQTLAVFFVDKDIKITPIELVVTATFVSPVLEFIWNQEPAEGKINDQEFIKRMVAGLTASTCRGILIDKLAGTRFRYVLPVADPATMFSQPGSAANDYAFAMEA